MATQSEAIAHSALVGGGQTALHSHAGGGGSTPDHSYFRHYGTGTYEAWFTSPNTGTALSTGTLTANRLYAMPFITPKDITLDRIAINVTTLISGNARLGIYSDGGNVYPGSRLLDAGEVSTSTTGVKSLTINQALSASSLYWLVIVANAAPVIRGFQTGSAIPILGISSGLGTAWNQGFYVSFTYGALPATYTGTPTVITASPLPAIFVRLSA